MEKRTLKALVLLISITLSISADQITFNELTKLTADALATNINLDKSIKNFKVDLNIVDKQTDEELYEYYKIVLQEHNLELKLNKAGNFYYIAKMQDIEPKELSPKPIPAEIDTFHYYSYKIKNITNKDVVKTMQIFNDVARFVHLKQSDIIAYSSTKKVHRQIQKMLNKSDNRTKEALVKITLFTTNKSNLISYGSTIKKLSIDLDTKINTVFNNLIDVQSPAQISFKKQLNFGFTFHALKGYGAVDILQEPTIRVTNGERAIVSVGLNVAYKESTVSIKENQQTTTDNIKYRDVGIQIDILPKIKNDWVHLELNLISEELISLQDNIPLTQKITYKSSVTAKRGEPVLLTGIKKTSMKLEKNGVPLLSNIPLIGELFKDRTENKEEQNINILIEVL